MHDKTMIRFLFLAMFSFSLVITFGQNVDDYYAEVIESADKYFQQKDYINAKAAYQYAQKIKPEEQYPKDRLFATVNILRSQKEVSEEYIEVLLRADAYYDDGAYDLAQKEYENALKIIPNQKYPEKRVKEIKADREARIQQLGEYNATIKEADRLYKEKEYEDAKIEYQIALSVFPGKTYPREKIQQIDQYLSIYQNKKSGYDEAIAEGDAYLLTQEYLKAKDEFEKALVFFPDEEYPKQKLNEIKPLIAISLKYEQLIADADNLYIVRDYQSAKAKYAEANELKPEETFPLEIIEIIDQTLREKATTVDDDYANAIVKGDEFFTNEQYKEARNAYEFANRLKPEESYPKEKLGELSGLIASMEKAEAENKAYNDAVRKGDLLFDAGNYAEAKLAFESAIEMNDSLQYPQQKIQDIEVAMIKLADRQKLLTKYNEIVQEADILLQAKEYGKARMRYENAAELVPEENYPIAQIEAINGIVAEIQQQQELEAAFASSLEMGDQFFQVKNYEKALEEYKKAASFKPDDADVTAKLSETEDILAAIALENAREEQYQLALEQAEEYYNSEDYENAKVSFTEAAEIKTDEEYPKQRLAEIDNLIAGMAEQKIIQAQYDSVVEIADGLFAEKKFENAIAEYNAALSIKEYEKYPKDQLTAIGNIRTDYNAQIQKAEELFNQMAYETAKAEFLVALEMIPDEEYPVQKNQEIDEILVKLEAERQQRYDSVMSAGQTYAVNGELYKARESYQVAMNLMPSESLPAQRLEDVNRRITAFEQEQVRKYNAKVAEGDKMLAMKAYDKAIASYAAAMEIDSKNPYPQSKVNEITGMFAQNTIINVVTDPVTITKGSTQDFTFDPIPVQSRKNSYILIKARNLGDKECKFYFNYGKDKSKNGGLLIKLPANNALKDIMIRVGTQYKWFSEDNNWFSIVPQGGDIEVVKVQVTTDN